MRKIAIYGKGGSGKSTISAALSVVLARRGLKVLHVGCDPKADSTLTLTSGKRIPTLLDLLAAGDRRPDPSRFVFPGRHGIDCVEAGGPKPGAGCGGRGVARMFELFQEVDLLGSRPYDVVLFDVLGDVVCGGFAAPLRLGFADLAFIVVSEEPLSLYAANNIIHAIRSYSANGVRLGGFILNVSDDRGGEALVRSVARQVGTQVVGIVPRDRDIQLAERRNLTAAELGPGSPTVQAFEQLADAILATPGREAAPLNPLPPEDLFRLLGASLASSPAGGASGGSSGQAAQSTSSTASSSAGGASSAAGEPSSFAGGASSFAGGASPFAGGASSVTGEAASVASGASSVAAGVSPNRPAGAMADGAPSALAHRSPRRLPADRSVVASKAVCGAFAKLLVLDRDPMARLLFDVESVQARRGILFVVLDSPSAGRVELQLSDSPDKAYGRVRDIAVSHSEPLPRFGRKVVDYCVARMDRAGVTFSDLCRWIETDPGSVLVASREETRDRRVREAVAQARHWNQWDGDSVAGVFFFPQERRRQVLAEVHLSDPVVLVQHGTQACGVSEQGTTEYSTHFVRFPWLQDRTGRESRSGAFYYLTDIREHELISGSNEALEGALRQVHKAHPHHIVVVEVSCTPVISGEDWSGTISRFRKTHKGPVLATAMAGDDLILELARAGRRLLDSEGESVPGIAAAVGRVHLVGFPRTRAVDELCGLLERTGVTIVRRLIPDVTLWGLGAYSSEASAQLLWPQVEYEPLYRELLLKARIPAVRVTPPFGPSGVRTFLEEAVSAAGLDVGEALSRVEPELASAEAELASMAQRAGSIRLGIGVTPHFASIPESPAESCGVPLTRFLRGLGFQVEVLQDAQDRSRLDWWLQSGLQAVFTELSFDRRLAAAGVAPFGLPDLEPGLAGCLRTARRLIRLAGTRFFTDFAQGAMAVSREGPA